MDRRGFTLAEMAVVLLVIVVLASIAIPSSKSLSNLSKICKAKSEIRSLQKAVDDYYLPHNATYPSQLNDLLGSASGFFKSIPSDPFSISSAPYVYALSPNKNYYVIYSVGKDGDGSAVVNDSGVITEMNGASCIYVSNAGEDS